MSETARNAGIDGEAAAICNRARYGWGRPDHDLRNSFRLHRQYLAAGAGSE